MGEHRDRASDGSLTDLPMSPDEDRQRRFRTYFYLMLVRVACLGIFFVVPGWWKLIPAFFAVFIPYFAVVIANVSTRRVTEGLQAPNALPPGSVRARGTTAVAARARRAVSLLSMLDGGAAATPCSSAGCAADAAHAVHWRNPRIHTPDRVKTWAACDAHRDSLAARLRSRGFPVVVTDFGETVERVG